MPHRKLCVSVDNILQLKDAQKALDDPMAVGYIFLSGLVAWVAAIVAAVLGGSLAEVIISYFVIGFATFATCIIALLVRKPEVREEWYRAIQTLFPR
ncbi:hypothetical protein [Qingshengfaniella alkalisoli]|uniref:Uncharacterized protein n=1 Tax=Qingshengfaniella alkalisoli TaxID=2599296 RepID=A0A5B8J3Y7_9RHOB|nr:hypothetical protein [Qingshengfaniella alkalisoli]QDY69010.1 hypothetical protein FPZ52_04790 [Qingshengfaniella alkalisoli]